MVEDQFSTAQRLFLRVYVCANLFPSLFKKTALVRLDGNKQIEVVLLHELVNTLTRRKCVLILSKC